MGSLAAQGTLGNLVAGIAILTDKPYRIGDYIVLDTGERGAVTAIALRSTRLLTRDDVEVSIPNGVMGRAKIVNESGSPERKYRLRVPVSSCPSRNRRSSSGGRQPRQQPRIQLRNQGTSQPQPLCQPRTRQAQQKR